MRLSRWFWTSQSGCRSFQTVYRVVLSAMALGARAGYLWWLVAAARLPNTESEHFDASPSQLYTEREFVTIHIEITICEIYFFCITISQLRLSR